MANYGEVKGSRDQRVAWPFVEIWTLGVTDDPTAADYPIPGDLYGAETGLYAARCIWSRMDVKAIPTLGIVVALWRAATAYASDPVARAL